MLKALNWAFRKTFKPIVHLGCFRNNFNPFWIETWNMKIPSDGESLWRETRLSRCFRFIQPDCTHALQHQRNCLAGERCISLKTHWRSAILLEASWFFPFFSPIKNKIQYRSLRAGKPHLKFSKSQKQIMKLWILPKNKRNALKILSWVCLVSFLEELTAPFFAFEIHQGGFQKV